MPGRFSRATLSALSFPISAMKCPPNLYLMPYPRNVPEFSWVAANPREREGSNIYQEVTILKGLLEQLRTKANGLMAEGVGFEPTIRFPVYTLSKRAPSATRPPLRTWRNIAA